MKRSFFYEGGAFMMSLDLPQLAPEVILGGTNFIVKDEFHVTLYTLKNKKSVGINNQQELAAQTRRLPGKEREILKQHGFQIIAFK